MAKDIFLIFLKWVIPLICGAITTAVLVYIKKRKKEDDALKEAVKSLLRSEIIRQYEKYSDKGYCPIYAREPLTLAHNAYHALGGNSTATDLYKKTIQLPTEEREDGKNDRLEKETIVS